VLLRNGASNEEGRVDMVKAEGSGIEVCPRGKCCFGKEAALLRAPMRRVDEG
jgi:hypothetical protein